MGNKKRSAPVETPASEAIAPGSAPVLPQHLLDELEAHKKQVEAETAAAIPGKKSSKKTKEVARAKKDDKTVAHSDPAESASAPAMTVEEDAENPDQKSEAQIEAEETQETQETQETIEATAETTTETSKDDDLTDPYEDIETDAAVANIIREESNQLLDHADQTHQQAAAPVPPKKRGPLRRFFGNKWTRGIFIFLLLAGIATGATIPESRYYALNTAGVRSSLSVSVTDQNTRLPLKNAVVSVAGQTAKTDSKGYARVSNVKLGKQTVQISQLAFAPITKQVVIGWGSNPLGDFMLSATGVQYPFLITDYLSGKPLAHAEITGHDATAISGNDGKAYLTLDNAPAKLYVGVSSKGYATTMLEVPADAATTRTITLKPVNKVVFGAREAGMYNIVRMNIDGSEREVILPGTGYENGNIALAVSPSGERAAVVSTRENIRDKDGYMLSSLTLVDVNKRTPITVEQGAQIRLLDWMGTKLVYQVTYPGESAADPKRQQIVSYDYTTGKRLQLATANQFQAVVPFKDAVYYAVGSSDPGAQAALFTVKADGTGRQTVVNQEVWSLIRSSYDILLLQTPTGWFTYKGSGSSPQATNAPTTFQSRRFVAGPQDQYAWVDIHDTQGALIIHNAKTGKDKTLVTQDGLNYPVRWLSDTVLVYRVANNGEIADYAVSTLGGPPKKLTDVTNTYGLGQNN